MRDTYSLSRVFEYTENNIRAMFTTATGVLDLAALAKLPTLFVEETLRWGDHDAQAACVGTITNARINGQNIALEYAYDPTIPPIPNVFLEEVMHDFGITNNFEFNRTHWAVKDLDLFRALLRHQQPQRLQPTVFRIAEIESVNPKLITAMMPFHLSFNSVYAVLQQTAESLGCECRRADDFWEHNQIIQDIVTLIDRSKIVICDCTGRNPNVFYEAGIAHALGREVVLITQNPEDIPFDLRHLRYIPYLNNGEGLNNLATRLAPRLSDLLR